MAWVWVAVADNTDILTAAAAVIVAVAAVVETVVGIAEMVGRSVGLLWFVL